MELNDKKITAHDVFLTALESTEQGYTNTEEQGKRNHLSGNNFIDKLSELLNIHGMKTNWFYEKKLGIKKGGLPHLIRLYSGMEVKEWRNEYIMLAAKELLLKTVYPLDQVGKRLGFYGITTFSKWFRRMEKIAPSKWRRTAKEEQAKQDKELLAQIKRNPTLLAQLTNNTSK